MYLSCYCHPHLKTSATSRAKRLTCWIFQVFLSRSGCSSGVFCFDVSGVFASLWWRKKNTSLKNKNVLFHIVDRSSSFHIPLFSRETAFQRMCHKETFKKVITAEITLQHSFYDYFKHWERCHYFLPPFCKIIRVCKFMDILEVIFSCQSVFIHCFRHASCLICLHICL